MKVKTFEEYRITEASEEHSITDISSIVQRKVGDWQQLFVNNQLGIEKEKVDKLKEHFVDYVFKAFPFVNKDNAVIRLLKTNFVRNYSLWGEFPDGSAENSHLLGEAVSIINAIFSIQNYI